MNETNWLLKPNGELSLTVSGSRRRESQAKQLGIEARTQVSPHLQRCCLILSASESYEHAALDLETLTGMRISSGTV